MNDNKYEYSTRKLRRTLTRVTKIQDKQGATVVNVIVPGWDHRKSVSFPASLIPDDIRVTLKSGTRLFAYVNTGAEEAEDLRFERFEIAPEPDECDGLA